MDDSLYRLAGMEGAKYVCAPPLKKAGGTAHAFGKALADRTIQTVVQRTTAALPRSKKALGKDDFTKIPGGMPGLRQRARAALHLRRGRGKNYKGKMCQLLSENPAKLYGMYPTKGSHCPGSDADIVVMRTGVEDMVTAADQVQNGLRSFEGRKLTARIESVFLRGTQVVKDHQGWWWRRPGSL